MGRKTFFFLVGLAAGMVGFFSITGVVLAATRDMTVGASVPSICGNGYLESGEECDDGNVVSNDDCSSACKIESDPLLPTAVCGNGAIEIGEQCDDGNTSNNDGCSSACQTEIVLPPVCGNGVVELGEQCDAGVNNGSACSAIYGQTCTYCLANCQGQVVTGPFCGDSIKQDQEQCDDGNVVNNDGCSSVCSVEPIPGNCGNSVVDVGETCDEGVANGSSCSAGYGESCGYCSLACHNIFISGGRCGDGILSGPEQCDDGNTNGEDGCTNFCTVNFTLPPPVICGNGIVEMFEQCDDGNGQNGDGCSSACQSEFTPPPPVLPPENPIIETIEEITGLPVPEKVEDIKNYLEEKTITVTRAVTKKVEEQIKKNLETVVDVGTLVNDFVNIAVDNVVVEETARRVVAPTAIVVSSALVMPSLWGVAFPFLRYLFFQPLLLFGLRKRKGWGEVYNSLTKRPIDLATVRLIEADGGRVMRSRVTDAQGRYLFNVGPGKYKIEIIKDGFVFPSRFLANVASDGRMLDIYHGELIDVTENDAVVTPNIPLDPVGVHKTPKRVKMEKYLRAFQHFISLGGIVMTLFSIYVSPAWYLLVFLFLHLGLYLLFLRLLKPKKPEGWGLVYDADSKKPIDRVIARLFSRQYNKLISTEITDKKGRYAFLVGPSDYYITFEKEGYEGAKKDVKVEGENEQLVKEKIAIKKGVLSSKGAASSA